MKEKKFFITGIIISIILITIGFTSKKDYYSTLILATGIGFGLNSIIQLIRLFYYQRPTNQSKYESKKKKARIDSIDERKQFMRAKSGQITYQIMSFCLILLDIVLALFRVDSWIIGLIFILFILQWIINVIIYHYLEKQL